MAVVRLPLVVLVTALVFLSLRYWGLSGRQDSCLIGLDRQLKLARKAEKETSENKDWFEEKLTQKDVEIATMKRETINTVSRLRACENEKQEVKDKLEEDLQYEKSALKKVNNDLEEMTNKLSKMNNEYTQSLVREDSLRKEKDELMIELGNSADVVNSSLRKVKDAEDELAEANEENLKKVQDLQDALKQKGDGENKKDVKPKNDAHIYKEKLLKDEHQPKRDIIDQKVEEAFAQVAKPGDNLKHENATLNKEAKVKEQLEDQKHPQVQKPDDPAIKAGILENNSIEENKNAAEEDIDGEGIGNNVLRKRKNNGAKDEEDAEDDEYAEVKDEN
jgi:hypothetical protein